MREKELEIRCVEYSESVTDHACCMADTRLLREVAAVALLRMLMACTSVSPAPASWAPGSPSVPRALRSGPQAPPCEPGNPRRRPGHPCGTAAGRRRRSPAWWQVRRGVATSAGRGRRSTVDWRLDASVVQSHQQQQQQLQGCTTGLQERWNTSVINTPHTHTTLFPLSWLRKNPRTFQDPRSNFPGPCRKPAMFKYRDKHALLVYRFTCYWGCVGVLQQSGG